MPSHQEHFYSSNPASVRGPLRPWSSGPTLARAPRPQYRRSLPHGSAATAEAAARNASPGAVARLAAGVERRNEVWRKLSHVSPGLLAFLLPLLPHAKPLSTESLVEITAITSVLTGLYVVLRRRVERENETDFYVTALSYPAAILAVLFAFPAAPELAVVVLVALAFGDGAAYFAGTRIGGRPLPWNRSKTWAGTLGFLIVAGPLATLAYRFEAGPETAWPAAALCGGGAVLAAAAAESLPTRLSDNLRVGVAAAVTVSVMHFFVAPAWV